VNEGRIQMLLRQTEGEQDAIFDVIPDGIIICERGTGLIIKANVSAHLMHAYARGALNRLPLTALIHPDSQREFNRQIAAQAGKSPLRIASRHVRADGSTFYAEWHMVPFDFEGQERWLAIVRDITEQMDAQKTLVNHIAARTREQAALLELSQTLAGTLEFQPGWILEQLRKVVEYSRGGFFSFEHSTLVLVAMRGSAELEGLPPVSINAGGADTLAPLLNAHRPILIPDWQSGSLQARSVRALLQGRAGLLLEGMQSWMWVPLAVRKRIIGGMGLAHVQADFFTPGHAALALSVANQAAITMVNAELYKSAQALAALQERQRLAQNLHDAVNQSLFSAGLIADVLPRIWDQGQDVARQSLDELSRLTRGAMAEMRALLAELRPAALTDADLGDLLRLLGNAFAGRTNIPTKVTVSGEGSLPADVQVTLYRICQEAITNIGKHAQAGSVLITLLHEGRAVDLRIADDGQGFDPQVIVAGHYGLSMMRERAQGIGAQLMITSKPGEGSEIHIRWPADNPEERP